MHVRRLATHVEVFTPAKINLFLEVLAKRSDGYHEIETLLTAISTYDALTFTSTEGDHIQLDFRWGMGLAALQQQPAVAGTAAHELLYGEVPLGPENLVWRAAKLLRDQARVTRGARIRLTKRIPAAAGLGGASSDAAATLIAGNLAWQLAWPRERLMELATELGSDVPFFLAGGPAVCRGRGERIEAVSVPRLHVVVIRPPQGLSTPQVYAACRVTRAPTGSAELLTSLKWGRTADVAQQLKNDLEPAAASLAPWISTLRTELTKQPFLGRQMSGSGSSFFGICHSARQSRRLASRLRAQNLGAVFSTATEVAT